MKDFIRVMKALSDPNRVKTVMMLKARRMCVCELTAALGVSQPTVSNHLKALEDAGLVESAKEGPWVNYFIPAAPAPCAKALLDGMDALLGDDPGIRMLQDSLEGIRREDLCSPKRGAKASSGESRAVGKVG